VTPVTAARRPLRIFNALGGAKPIFGWVRPGVWREQPMKQTLSKEDLALCRVDLLKAEARFHSVDEIVEYLRSRIEAHPMPRFIAVFDHYAHTASLPEGVVSPEILAAKNVVFCFGLTLPDPEALALRPRSIGVCELADRFVITFLEPPMPVANTLVEEWVRSICNGLGCDEPGRQ
jgi:hypothetical protein